MRTINCNSAIVRRAALFGLALLVINAVNGLSATAKPPRPFGGRVVAKWDNVFNALPDPLLPLRIAKFTGTSQMLHMGRSSQEGTLRLGELNLIGLYPGSGTVTITAANGDKVTFTYEGFLNPSTGVGSGPLEIVSGTGRFAGATGSGTFYAVIDVSNSANQAMTVLLDGVINY